MTPTKAAPTPEVMPEHKRIWLAPACTGYVCSSERMWCEDDMGPCDDCGAPSVEYILAHATPKPEDKTEAGDEVANG